MSRNILDLNGLFTPTYVGFDRLFNEMLKTQSRGKSVPQYPPYNLIKDGETYTIEMAMAGLTDKDIDIVLEERTLTISYDKTEETRENLVHQGLAQRSFKRSFNLADDIEIKKATLKNGLLSVEMERIIPEEKKPIKIKISK
ncbi:MAG: Hsp20 family protein [Minisyncoccia bacterium]